MAFVPGTSTRSARATSAGERVKRTLTPGSAVSASTSVKLLIQRSRTTATSSVSPAAGRDGLGRGASSASESSASSHIPSSHGRTPNVGRPVRRPQLLQARARGCVSSPRNLLMTKPATSAWSSGSSSARLPYSDAKTPPRSMSPTSTTGMSAARARPMFARSPARRLISAGLPAPSQTTTS